MAGRLNKQMITPFGVAKWTFLEKPDKANEKGERHYRTEIHFNKTDPEVKKFFKEIADMAKECGVKKRVPYYTSDEDPNVVVLRCKTKNKPKLLDSKGKEIKKACYIGQDSIIRAGALIFEYDNIGHGIGCAFDVVQIKKLVQFVGGASSDISLFGEVEGDVDADDFTDDPVFENNDNEAEEAEEDGIPEGDIPF